MLCIPIFCNRGFIFLWFALVSVKCLAALSAGTTKPAMCYLLFSSTALYSTQGGGQHRIFSGENNFLSFFSL